MFTTMFEAIVVALATAAAAASFCFFSKSNFFAFLCFSNSAPRDVALSPKFGLDDACPPEPDLA